MKQYLQHCFPTTEKRHNFYTWLKDEIPFPPDIAYAYTLGDVPFCVDGKEDEISVAYVHISAFGFGPDAGLTGNVDLCKSEVLLQLIVAHGFTTAEDPSRVRWSTAAPVFAARCVTLAEPDFVAVFISRNALIESEVTNHARDEACLEDGSMLFLKGQSRTLTALGLLCFMHQKNASVKQARAELTQ